MSAGAVSRGDALGGGCAGDNRRTSAEGCRRGRDRDTKRSLLLSWARWLLFWKLLHSGERLFSKEVRRTFFKFDKPCKPRVFSRALPAFLRPHFDSMSSSLHASFPLRICLRHFPFEQVFLILHCLRSGSAAGGGGQGGSRGAGGGSGGGVCGGEGQAESVWEYARRAAGQGRE